MKKDWKNDFDKNIKKDLNSSVKNAFPSCDLKRKIDLEISNQENTKERGDIKMKKSRIGVVLAAAAILCGGVFAYGKYKGTISSSSSVYDYTAYEDTVKAEDKVGFDAVIPENLGDYKFDGISIGEVSDIDENNETYNERNSLNVIYKNADKKMIFMDVDKLPKDAEPIDKEFYKEIREYDGVNFYYTQIENLFVSSENDLTPEEKERSESDPFFNVGIGGPKQEREEKTDNHLTFELNGIRYSLLAGTDVSSDELFEMGQEFVK